MKLELQNNRTLDHKLIGLSNSELISFKDLLDLDYDGNTRYIYRQLNEDEGEYLTVTLSRKDPDILFYEYETVDDYVCGICDKLTAIGMLEDMGL